MKASAALFVFGLVFTGVASAQGQAPAPAPAPPAVKTPSQEETLAKWPWSIAHHKGQFKQDAIEIQLQPKEGMEYKYRLEKGAGFVYSWTATAPLHCEMHSVPDGAPSTFAETFEKLDDRGAGHGNYVAPFPGIHGWYWQNRTKEPATLKMTTAGFYTQAQEFRRGQPPKMKEF